MGGEPLSILLVDDEGFFISLLASQLRDEYGYRTDTAFSGKEAIQKIGSARSYYDVVILDYLMPEVSGLNVLQRMHEQKNETPVVMLTAAGSETIAVEAMKLGAYDYVRKEHVDVHRLAVVIQATHERRLFRITKELEREKEQEIRLNLAATERARRVLNVITPRMNEEIAGASVDLELRVKLIRDHLPEQARQEFEIMIHDLRKHLAALGAGINGLFQLFSVLYARHSDETHINQIKGEFESRVAELEQSDSDRTPS